MGAVASPSELDRALTVLAYYGGNAARASKELGISERTLRDWRSDLHRERYLEIAEREGPRLEALAANQARELLIRAAHVEHGILDRLSEQPVDENGQALELTTKELSELAGALQRVTTSKGINTTKLLELTGRPTVIHAMEDPIEAGKRLLQKHGIAVDSTATEVPNHPELPLPPQSAEANARDSSVSSPASTPTD
jgi:transposase